MKVTKRCYLYVDLATYELIKIAKCAFKKD